MGHEFISPLRRWDVIAGLCEAVDAQLFVEVGCKDGRTTAHILKTLPRIRVIAIDPWVPQAATDDPARETYAEWDFGEIERKFWQHVKDNEGAITDRCQHLRMTSAEAAALPDWGTRRPPDVVFIDALHDYDSVVQDISLWWPIVNSGGYLCGHDYNHKWPSVMRAVADQFPLMRVGVCPDSVWMVQKDPRVRLAA